MRGYSSPEKRQDLRSCCLAHAWVQIPPPALGENARPWRLLLLSVVFGSFVFRAFLVGNTTFNSWDEAEFALLAESLREGRYSLMGEPFKLHPPFFAMLNASVRAASKLGLISYRLVSVVMGSMAAVALYLFGKKLDGRAGTYAAMLLSLSPFFFQFSSRAFSDATLSFFLLFSVYTHLYRRGVCWLMVFSSALIKLSSLVALVLMNALDLFEGRLREGMSVYLPYLSAYAFWKCFSFLNSLRMGEPAGEAAGGYNWLLEGLGVVVPESSRQSALFYLQNLHFLAPFFPVLALSALAVFLAERRRKELAMLLVPLLFMTLWSVKTPRYFVPVAPILFLPIGVALSRLEKVNKLVPLALIFLVALQFPERTSWMADDSFEWLDCGAYLKENTESGIATTSPMEVGLYSGREVAVPHEHTLEQFTKIQENSGWVVLAERYEGDFQRIHEDVEGRRLPLVQEVPYAGIRVLENTRRQD